MADEQTEVLLRVLVALESVDAPYLGGGSFASSAHGVYRTTADVDLLVELRTDKVAALVAKLEDEFYADGEMMQDSLRTGNSFNLIHFATGLKVDVFPAAGTPFERQQLSRRSPLELGGERAKTVYFASPEDTVLAKLRWYRETGETSDRQWTDVLGVLKVQRERLDVVYLQRWAEELGVADLLARVRADAG